MVTYNMAEMLYEEAKKASLNSYSPYSAFAVGAAVLTTDNTIFTGCNIENASYGATICAERVAICNTISQGHRNISAIAVYSPEENVSPCGSCRQFIVEFGQDIDIVFKSRKKLMVKRIQDLIPIPFTSEELK